MADINQESERLAQILNQVNQELLTLNSGLSQTSRSQIDNRDSLIQAQTGIRGFSKGTAVAVDGLTAFSKGLLASTAEIYRGRKGMAVFNSSIDGAAAGLSALAAALAIFLPIGRVAKAVLALGSAAGLTTAQFIKLANIMNDQLYKGMTDLYQSGGAASDGLTGLFNDAQKLGLAVDELGIFIEQVAASAPSLVLFRGTVFEGRQALSDVVGEMVNYRQSLFSLGITQEEQIKGTTAYIRLQTRLGLSQDKNSRELAEGSRKYLIEMDALSKLTGQSRKEMEDQMESARSEQRFRARLEQLVAENRVDEARSLEEANLIISSQSKEMGQAFRDISTGFITSEAAQKGLIGTQGELLRQSQLLAGGQTDTISAVQQIGVSAGIVARQFNTLAQVGIAEDIIPSFAGSMDLARLTANDLSAIITRIRKEQEQQGATGQRAQDEFTARYAALIREQQDTMLSLQRGIFYFRDSAMAASDTFSSILNTLATTLESVIKAFERFKNLLNSFKLPDWLKPKAPTLMLPQSVEEAQARAKEAQARAEETRLNVDQSADNRAILEAAQRAARNAQRAARNAQRAARNAEDLARGKSPAITPVVPQPGEGHFGRQQPENIPQPLIVQESNIRNEEAAREQTERVRRGQTATVRPPPGTAGSFGNFQDGTEVDRFGVPQMPSTNNVPRETPAPSTGTAPSIAIPRPTPPAAPATPPVPVPVKPAPIEGEQSKINEALVVSKLLDLIGRAESAGGNYNILSGGRNLSELTGMTVANVLKFQQKMLSEGYPSTAVGKYQIIQKKLQELVDSGVVKLDDVFDSTTQDRLAHILLQQRGLSEYSSGRLSLEEFAKNLAQEWAGLPMPNGQSYYQGVGNNKSNIPYQDLVNALKGAADGGIFQGPKTGYAAMLHGTEAVIPLKNGSVPVALQGENFAAIKDLEKILSTQINDREYFNQIISEASKNLVEQQRNNTAVNNRSINSNIEQTLSANLQKTDSLISLLTELVREQRNSNDISSRILQVAAN